eukprot:m.17834 g.17834  ORF g.17834 m.17834 type:complete len:151 (+) comp10701_c0_seq2:84-536(+)
MATTFQDEPSVSITTSCHHHVITLSHCQHVFINIEHSEAIITLANCSDVQLTCRAPGTIANASLFNTTSAKMIVLGAGHVTLAGCRDVELEAKASQLITVLESEGVLVTTGVANTVSSLSNSREPAITRVTADKSAVAISLTHDDTQRFA